MTQAPVRIDEDWRRICEARNWLKRGYRSRAAVAELITRIEAMRGRDAAQRLLLEMRQQWACRESWLTPTP